MNKTYELPNGKTMVAEFDENGVGKITVQALDSLVDELNYYADQEPCDDAISRKSVINTLVNMDNALDENRTVEEYKALLKECYEVLPSVRPQEPKTGLWIRVTDKTGHLVWECDKCSWQQRFNANFCPDCGARMV